MRSREDEVLYRFSLPRTHAPTHPVCRYVDEYIVNAPPGSNMATHKPRYHGTANRAHSVYISNLDTFEVCAGGHCVDTLFDRKMDDGDYGFVGHFDDMSGGGNLVWISPPVHAEPLSQTLTHCERSHP